MERCAKSFCGCLCSSSGGFLYAAAYMFATMFTCPVDHHSDICQKRITLCDSNLYLQSKCVWLSAFVTFFFNYVGSFDKEDTILYGNAVERSFFFFLNVFYTKDIAVLYV